MKPEFPIVSMFFAVLPTLLVITSLVVVLILIAISPAIAAFIGVIVICFWTEKIINK